MTRKLLSEERTHPAIRETISKVGDEIVAEVEAAIAKNGVVVVGMAQNPFPKKARRALDAAGVAYQYLEYGSYFSQWRPRTALKMWAGWPTLPMIFVKGVLVGGANDVIKLIESGELAKMLA
jgi:glutaredoxin-related protein